MTESQTIPLRVATDRDATVLEQLSALDSKPVLHAPAVVALVDGRPVAAASRSHPSAAPSPSIPTAEVFELLQARIAASTATASAQKARSRPRFPRVGLP